MYFLLDNLKYSLLLVIFFVCVDCTIVGLREKHETNELSKSQVQKVGSLENREHLQEMISAIAIERVVGTPGHKKVKEFIVDTLEKNNWHVERNKFEDQTPTFGRLKFENIIGTLNPNAERYLVLACHYDSKYIKNKVFIGATDSAVPCAMMLNIIHVMSPYLNQLRDKDDISLKLVFFDGEEAFHRWGPRDSIYGARHLAKKLSQEQITLRNSTVKKLDQWDVLVLLDLLGAPDPTFYNFIQSGSKWVVEMITAEQRLAKLNLLKKYNSRYPYFRSSSHNGGIEDDHIPFLQRGVPIVHMITYPFPKEWHTTKDNLDIIDIDTTMNLNKILQVFIAEYLHLYIPDDE